MTTREFTEMLAAVVLGMGVTSKHFAECIGISPQYLSDLERGRRLPSVAVVNRICTYMGRGPQGRKAWHLAGARAHGWEV
jgi:transcriptional regulator with XRE-family HTH domain